MQGVLDSVNKDGGLHDDWASVFCVGGVQNLKGFVCVLRFRVLVERVRGTCEGLGSFWVDGEVAVGVVILDGNLLFVLH